jgi:citrate lyase subunit beta / citryl-CoA lyase
VPTYGAHDEAAGRMSQVPQAVALRSLLFVPGDSERKQAKALTTAADALILDLEDAVDLQQLPAARSRVRELLRARPAGSRPQLWVRINPPAGRLWQDDLEAIFADGTAARTADGIVVPKVSTPAEIILVAQQLQELEARCGTRAGSTRLLVIATETPLGVLSLPQYPAVLGAAPAAAARLAGLTWGVEDLGTALGVLGRRDASGALTFTFQMARSACLLTAAALGVHAIDSVHVDFRDAQGLRRELDDARRDGFSGKLAIHPDQVAAINAAFAPTAVECAQARRIVAAFAAAGGVGVASLDGQMIDRPHLIQAQRILAAAARTAAEAENAVSGSGG